MAASEIGPGRFAIESTTGTSFALDVSSNLGIAGELIAVRMSVQPANGEELDRLEFGQKATECLELYTESLVDLRTADDVGLKRADVLLWRGREFEIVRASRFEMDSLPHVEALAVRFDAEDLQ
ncbi:MAG: hypothetical protein D6741_18920 [Planctomycetota bacterium]|nr:MAG: hypothetical protein D6741_18920 [Planctomycetota bacterium]